MRFFAPLQAYVTHPSSCEIGALEARMPDCRTSATSRLGAPIQRDRRCSCRMWTSTEEPHRDEASIRMTSRRGRRTHDVSVWQPQERDAITQRAREGKACRPLHPPVPATHRSQATIVLRDVKPMTAIRARWMTDLPGEKGAYTISSNSSGRSCRTRKRTVTD